MGFAVAGVLALGRRVEVGPFWTVAAGGLTGALVYVSAGLLLGVRALRWLPGALLARGARVGQSAE
jgi:hypothetical protein